jgi:MoCo/4Fe-4S cofactor protein with predicted Tat translocation signal
MSNRNRIDPAAPELESLRSRLNGARGPEFWRSLDELSQTDDFEFYLHREFPVQASEWDEQDEVGRRQFLRVMGASLALAGLILCGATASADEPAPLSDQLLGLGRQALAQGHRTEAASFLSKALEIDPTNSRARQLLADSGLLRVALQDPGAGTPPPPAPGVATDATLPPPAPGVPVDGTAVQPGTVVTPGSVVNPAPMPGVIDGGVVAPAESPAQGATLEQASELDRVLAQQLTTDIRERQQRARNLLNDRQPQSALTQLRLAQNAIQAAQDVPENVRKQLSREVQAQIQGDQLRVTGKKRDDLQEAIGQLRTEDWGLPIQFTNFRD